MVGEAVMRRVYMKTIWKSGNLRRHVGVFRRQLRRVEARGTASGDQIFGFSLRETEEHACVVGFFRQRLDLHRSVR